MKDTDDETGPASLAGQFLISGVQLMDPNFFRTVVLMIHHNEEGAFGIVLNRPAEKTLGNILPEIGSSLDIPVFIGGPVQQDYLFVLHSGLQNAGLGDAAARPVSGVVFEPATKDLIRYFVDDWASMAVEDRPKIRLYAGYSGWAPGQLERELREHAWFTHPAKHEIVFHSDPEYAWKDALSQKGKYYKFVADTGYMPSVNQRRASALH